MTVNVTTPPITRADLMSVFGGNERMVRTFEKMLNDVRTNLPDAIVSVGDISQAPFVFASASSLAPNAKVLTAGSGVTLTPATETLTIGIITPLPVNLGGTGGTTAGAARGNLGAAASGINGDITQLTGLTTPLAISEGGTNATDAATALSNLGGVTAAQAAAGAPVQSVFGRTGTVVAASGDYTAAQVTGAAHNGANSDITSLSGLTTALSVTQGGTGASTAAGARGNLSAAASGANGDITSLTGLNATGIVGQTAGADATAGSVGEYAEGSSGGTSLTSGTTVNATSITLPAGDWDVWGQVLYLPTASNAVVGLAAGLTTTSATLPAAPDTTYLGVALTVGTGGTTALNVLPKRFNVAATTTVYLVAEAGSVTGGSGCTVNGYIRRRRRR